MESLLAERNDDFYMGIALKLAQDAFEAGEVPVGAIIVSKEKIIAKGFNQKEMLHDPTAHAEMIAITQAAEALGDWRLTDTTLYVTLEPCFMCAGAVLQSRIKKIVYGAPDSVGGACGSVMNIFSEPSCNHTVELVKGVREDECGDILRDFFREKRRQQSIASN